MTGRSSRRTSWRRSSTCGARAGGRGSNTSSTTRWQRPSIIRRAAAPSACLASRACSPAAMRRASIPEEERVDFAAYLDEFHNFTTDAFASILAEARKYHLSLVIGHQYLDQVSHPVRAAVFGNVGTLVSFAVGHSDAEELAGEFDPYGIQTLTGLTRGQVCVRSSAGGETAYPFLGETIGEVGWRYGGR